MQELPTKYCRRCDQTLSVEDFYVYKSGKRAGHKYCYCKSCSVKFSTLSTAKSPEKRAIREKNYRLEGKNKINRRNRQLVSLYGITLEYFNSLPQECSLCGATENLCADHCHQTGKFRSILCKRCNSGLGYFKDDPHELTRAIEYIKMHRWEHLKTLC